MANRDLLKEAIADAKALKETAIANAKVALEEAFEPRLKSMLSAKLEEMEKEDLEESDVEMNEAKEELDEKSDRKDGGESKETKRTEKMKYGKDLAEAEVDEEMDLDEILAELEGDLSEDARTDAEEEGYKDGMEDEKEDMEDKDEDEEIDLDDLSEDDLKSFIEDVIADMVTAGELEAGDEFEVEDEEDIEVEDDTEVDVEVNEAKEDMDEGYGKENMDEAKDEMDEGIMDKLKAAYNDKELLSKIVTVDGEKVSMKDLLGLAGAGATGGMAKSGAGKSSSIGEDARTDAEEEGYLDGMKDEKEDMDEMKKEIEELRSDLHETNLLNAKLLYTNKIFRAKNLKEAQKVKVLEAFDKASNVKEVKLIFETLNEGMVAKPVTQIKESLGSASKPAGVAKKAPIMEIDPQVARWQKLAGLK